MTGNSLVNIDFDLLRRIKKIVYSRKAKGEKISIKQWIFEACQEKIKKDGNASLDK